MVAAVSRDGFITDEDKRVKSWTSEADQEFYADMTAQYGFYVMASGTYDAAKPEPKEGTLRVILTSRPDTYADDEVPERLVFRDLTPSQFRSEYGDHKSCLLLGGGHIYKSFLEDDLVDEIYLTREPKTLNSGTPLIRYGTIDNYLDRFHKSEKPLNNSGTVLEHYVKKS